MAQADFFVDVNMNSHALTGATITLGADLNANSHKITNLTNGAAAHDAAAFGQIPTSLPTTQSLDQIATAHVTAADWSNNSKKITSVAHGAGANEVATFDQIPTALPPNGSAGGDLTGTYPNPTLAAAGGGAAGPIGSATVTPIVTVDAKGRVTALSSATTVPTNAAGGDLTGNYPNPTLASAGGGAAGPIGSATVIPIVTVDAKGRVTALSSATAAPTNAAGGGLAGNYPNPTVNADGTSVSNSGSTLAVVTGIVGGAYWTTIRKASDTGRNTTVTVAIDPALQFTATSGVLYEVELIIIYVSTAGGGTPDFKEGVGEDGTARGTEFHFGASATDTAASAIGLSRTTDNATWGTAATNRGVSIKGFHVGNGGTFGLFWAQGTSNGNDTTVKAGSVLRYRAIT